MPAEKQLYENLRAKIKKARKTESNLTIELRDLESDLLKLDIQIAVLRCEPTSEEQVSYLAKLIEKRNPAEVEHNSVLAQLSDIRTQLATLLEEFNKLKQAETFSLIQGDLIDQKKLVEHKRLELKIMDEQSIKFDTAIAKIELEILNIENLITLSEKTIKESQKELKANEKAFVKKNKSLERVKNKIDDLLEDIAKEEEELIELAGKLENAIAQPSSSEKDKLITTLNRDIEKVKKNQAGYQEKLNEERIEQEPLSMEVNSLKQNIATNTLRINSIAAKLMSMEGKLSEKLEVEKELSFQKTELDRTYSLASAEYQNLLNKLDDLLIEFEVISDPSILVSQFNDDTPFMLFPLRVETKFMTIKHVKRIADPPVVPIPKEEALEFLGEIQGPVDEKTPTQKLAEFEVVKPQKVLSTNTAPELIIPDKHELWVRIFPDDLAIHTHEERLAEDELEAGKVYWNEMWRAGLGASNDANIELGAWRVLVRAYGSQRAAWIALQTEPANQGDRPSSPIMEGDPLPIDPVFPSLVTRPSSWTETAKSKIMPDRFVVRAYTDTNSFVEVTGNSIPDPLPLGMNPTSLNDDFQQVDRIVDFPDDIKWMTNFEEAEKIGMGIRIPLEVTNSRGEVVQQISGFNRLFVLGLKLSANKTEATRLVEELIDNHHYTEGGFAIVPQGTPTNNTEDATSGYSAFELDEEDSFKVERNAPLFTLETDPLLKNDGQWFSELIGISPTKIEHIHYADGTDWKESFAMNGALWPATMGYYLDQIMSPSISPVDIIKARQFYCDFVHGRGHIPSFRVDNQPYGVLLTSAFSKWEQSGSALNSFSDRLFKNVLKPMDTQWGIMSETVANVSDLKDLDPKEAFLEILGLHASSVEFYQRFTAGSFLAWNLKKYVEGHPLFTGTSLGLPEFDGRIPNYKSLFETLGFNFNANPRIFGMLFLREQRLLDGPVIDSLLLSEKRRIENFPSTNTNYIEWLLQSTLQEIRDEDFSNIADAESGQKPPQALLYLLLRQACFLEYLNTAYGYLEAAELIAPEDKVELEFQSEVNELTVEEQDLVRSLVTSEVSQRNELTIETQVQEFKVQGSPSENVLQDFRAKLKQSMAKKLEIEVEDTIEARVAAFNADRNKWNYLINTFDGVTNGKPMMDYIVDQMQLQAPNTDGLRKLKNALELLKDIPTARLERCFAEHLDTCNYRLDAWLLGLVNERLQQQQLNLSGSNNPGVYLGSYGMLEEVYPGDFPGIHVEEIETKVAKTNGFVYLGSDPFTQLQEDSVTGKIVAVPRVNPENQGYIHAPSMNHAVTAAILRAGYLGHANTLSPNDALAVNLTSARIRKALYYLEGIRNGQTLPAMLGYQLERGMHDSFAENNETNLDQYILDIRLAYPLIAGGVIENNDAANITESEASNVIDGLSLIETYRESLDGGSDWFSTIPSIPTAAQELITEQIKKVSDHMDAISDLSLAESMYQITQGNHERAGAMMKAITEGNNPPEPQIVKTPRLGNVLTQRVMIHFDTMAGMSAIWPGSESPRSFTEPNVNTWIASHLPPPNKICVNVEYTTIDALGEDLVQTAKLSINVLNIQPIDLIYILNEENEGGDASEFSLRFGYYVKKNLALRGDKPVKLSFMDRTGFMADEVSVFELIPLVKALAKILGDGRPVVPEDFLLSNDSAQNVITGIDTSNVETRLIEAIGSPTTPGQKGMYNILEELNTANAAAKALDFDALPVGAEAILNSLRESLLKASGFGSLGGVPGSGIELNKEMRDNLTAIADRIKIDFDKRISDANEIMTTIPSIVSEAEKSTSLSKVAEIIFGRAFKVFPEFTIFNQTDYDIALMNPNLLNDAGDFPIEEWMQGISKVKPRIACLQQSTILSEVFGNTSSELKVAQFPLHPTGDDRWLGVQFPEDYEVPDDTLSLVMDLPPNYDSGILQAGILLDEWTEQIPDRNAITGIAMNFDQPNTKAPQTVLMAVTPKQTGSWEWNDLMDTLDETLRMAKKRAVEPDIFNKSLFAQVLPAIMAPISGTDNTPSLDFARNVVRATSGQVGPITVDSFIAGD